MIVGVAATLAAAVGAVVLGERWWPLAFGGLVPLAAAWWLLAAVGAARCLPLAGAPRADAVGWLARASMLPMLAGWPAMTALCGAAGLAPATMAGLHAALMLLPLLAPRPWPRALVAGVMAASALPLWMQPGAEAWMAASALQALACGLAMRHPPAATSGRALPASVGVTLALGLALADGGPALLMQLQLVFALAAPAALLVPALRHCGPSRSHEALPPG